MKDLTESLALFELPLWLTAALAALIGTALLAAFVDTLHENARRGEAVRQWQRVGAVRHAIGAVTSTVQGVQDEQSGTSIPTSSQ